MRRRKKIADTWDIALMYIFDALPWLFGLLALTVVAMGVIMIVVPLTDHNTDPRKGTVFINTGTKECDGANLVYRSSAGLFSMGGVSVVPNSPECKAL
jgi:hypothetical protein